MKFHPESFIDISKELDATKSEAHIRSIVNRAYYGAFGYIKDQVPYLTTGPSVHKDLIRSLKDSTKINEKKAGNKLESLFKKRLKADYDYNFDFSQSNSSFSILDAEKIIELFDEEDPTEY